MKKWSGIKSNEVKRHNNETFPGFFLFKVEVYVTIEERSQCKKWKEMQKDYEKRVCVYLSIYISTFLLKAY